MIDTHTHNDSHFIILINNNNNNKILDEHCTMCDK